ncbi:MAG: GGDEF domain-containing protein [Lachnospiraceae bacterium]|nr:GGDEF domain-containing protein [Lachnospiraceae bacterium]
MNWIIEGKTMDLDSFSTDGAPATLSKRLPANLNYNDSLCFISSNAFFDVYIGDELVYPYKETPNFTGTSYGTSYHYINLNKAQAGELVTFNLRSAYKSGRAGSIRMLSIENAQKYSNRMASGQLLPFIVSAGIFIIGCILLLFSFVYRRSNSSFNAIALAISAMNIGCFLAVDTGFLRLSINAISLSRNLFYFCMYLCALPVAYFLFSLTTEKKRIYIRTTFFLTIVFYAIVLFYRFACDTDMSSSNMIKLYFIYIIIISVILNLMLLKDYRHCKKNGLQSNTPLFYTGFIAVIAFFLIDIITYLSGMRSVSGYATFSRIGFYIFFTTMAIDVIRSWAREYNSLWKYGFTDALTNIGNRRAYLEYEKENIDVYPYGFVICDINKLKYTNDTYGHDAGDKLITAVAHRLIEVFGSENVFRVGGDEFVAYSFNVSESEFASMIENAKKLLSGEDVSASIGNVYINNKAFNREEIKKEAERIMYEEKKKYYQASSG